MFAKNLAQLLPASKKFHIVGILNTTPDSFSDGGKYDGSQQAIQHALKMAEEGACIIDIGGESTRPGTKPVLLNDELTRVIPAIEGIRKYSDIPISVDTTKSQVAQMALEAGANIINDISACTDDEKMIDIINHFKCPVLIMHKQGTPETMQNNPKYANPVLEVKQYLQKQANHIALKTQLTHDNIIIDPGIGFGKSFQHNHLIMQNIEQFCHGPHHVLIGISRKSYFKTLINRDVSDRLSGTIAANIFAYLKGVKYFRVHDVKENLDALKTIYSLGENV